MVTKNKNKNDKNVSQENFFSKNGAQENNKIKLQEFYGSFLGNNIQEVKKNSQRLRFKIYSFGFIIIIIAIILNFFVLGKISFVTS